MMRIPEYSILKYFNARGCVVPGYGTRRGRCDKGMNQVGEWGGHHRRKAWSYRFIHQDAVLCLDEFFS
eukprot:13184873-Ditylum_brightwellii.AAC.1